MNFLLKLILIFFLWNSSFSQELIKSVNSSIIKKTILKNDSLKEELIYDYNNLIRQSFLINNIYVGIEKEWYKNGQIKSIGYYKNNIYDTVNWAFKDVYFENKVDTINDTFIFYSKFFKDVYFEYKVDTIDFFTERTTLLKNYTKKWFSNGQIEEECYNGGRSGTLKIFWYEFGNIKSVGFYINNKKNDKWLYWNESVNLIKEEIYNKGELIEIKEYDEKGNLIKKQ